MRYKAEYSPSYLLDPVTYQFLSFEEVCKPILDKDDHAIFSEYRDGRAKSHLSSTETVQDPSNTTASDEVKHMNTGNGGLDDSEDETDEEEERLSEPPPPGFLDPDNLPQELVLGIYTFEHGKPLPLVMSRAWRMNADKRRKIQEGIAAMGDAAVETCLFA